MRAPPQKEESMVQQFDSVLYLRVPRALLDQLDAIVSERKAAQPGHALNRSDVAREILMERLAEEQGERAGRVIVNIAGKQIGHTEPMKPARRPARKR
jgi:hypothetical protein